MFTRPLSSFVPSIYKGIMEMDSITDAEEQIMDLARKEVTSAFANTFILTSDESGVIMFERMLNIIADPQAEDLEFRRQRVLNRLSMSPPFTFNFLQQKLNEIIGEDAWKAYIDYGTYTLYVEASASDQNWYSEVEFTINQVKPCNLVFINVPCTAESVVLSERLSYTQMNWKYRLGSWRLGQFSFAMTDGGVVKVDKTKSVQQALLDDTATYVASEISAVLINDSIKISSFKSKQASENVVCVEYTVVPDMTNLVTDVKLLRADDTVLTHIPVYVPVTQTVVGKHLITVKEGA